MVRIPPALLVLALLFLSVGCSGDDDETVYECMLLQPNHEVRRLRDFQYARNRFFDLGLIAGIDHVEPGDSLITMDLYQSVSSTNPAFQEAVAYPNSLEPQASPDSVVGRFRQLGYGYDWNLVLNSDSGQFTLVFRSPLPDIDSTTIACYMQIKKAGGSLLNLGDKSVSPLRLQVVKLASPQTSDPLWAAEWKNVYDLGGRDLNWLSLDIQIYKAPFGEESDYHSTGSQDGVTYLRLLELDREPVYDGHVGDGRVDNKPDVLWLESGLLVFPSRQPFADAVLHDPVPMIYATNDLGDLVESSEYHLTIRTTGFGRYVRLNRINLVEGSERIAIGDRLLVRGSDYNIDYLVGEVEFIHSDVMPWASSIQICYEYVLWRY